MKRFFALLTALLLLAAVASADAEDFIVRNGDRDQKRIAITIDDCYGIEQVRQALEISSQYDVPFTFFVLGIVIKPDDAELWQEIAASDCEIGNHTFGHYNLPSLKELMLYKQIMHTQEALDAVLGYHYPIQVIRPPYGHWDSKVKRLFRATGYEHAILWDVASTDPQKCYKSVQNGSILLFHARSKDIACIEAVLPKLLEDGYEPVTVSELLGMDPVEPSDEPYKMLEYHLWLEQRREQ